MRILMISSTFPYPPSQGGTHIRTFNLLKYLSHKHSVTLVTQRSPDVNDAEVDSLRAFVEELAMFPCPQKPNQGIGQKLRRFSNFLIEGTPPSVLSRYSPEMQKWIDDFVGAGKCEAILCEHSVNEIYVRPQWQEKVKTLVNVHSSVYGSCRLQLETGTEEKPWRDRINLPLLLRYEKRYCSKFSHIVATTEDDGKQLQEFSPNSKIAVIPNGVDLSQFPYRSADPGGKKLVFVGAMDYLSNIDAARFLTLEILPKVQERYPDTTLALVGTRPVPEVKELATHPGVKVTGRVPSVVDYFHQATVCVIPMRSGFGIKNKTLESMATGIPVVASDRGLEGLAADGADTPLRALRANDVGEYVEAIGRLFEDGQLRQKLSENGRSLIETDYTWEVQGHRYEQVLLG
ncbi:glycosyltransferase family 4 protein [Okeania sp.]|uniref:glycosyltransferase family 4 protein n=1 Tax=Okeania sp. TaxID=3100323 RepID=UPI002B4B38F3|nr:glycosyltransferase family 4 protein [Okeania sp.]MEB3342456.1 glycosyltransferase family 4 protein [Okeania sp.]